MFKQIHGLRIVDFNLTLSVLKDGILEATFIRSVKKETEVLIFGCGSEDQIQLW